MNASLALTEPLPRPVAKSAPAPKLCAAQEGAEAAKQPTIATSEPREPVATAWRSTERRHSVIVGVALLHVGAAWVLARSLSAPVVVPPPGPVEVRLVTPPPRSEPPVPARTEVQLPLAAPVPLVQPPVLNVAVPVVVAQAQPAPPVVARAAPVADTAPPAHATAAPREIPASAVHYLVEPQLHVPKMSRRLGESGTVLLHIVVDAGGQLRAAVVKKSSGFERLDQQALQDIRTARFAPYLDKGQAIDWEADAGLQYEVR